MAEANTSKSGNFIEDLLLNGQIAWRLYGDPRVSMLLKVALPLAALLYFIIPVDLMPDFIPVIGQLDEVAVVLLLIRLFVSLAPADVVSEYRNKTGKADSGTRQNPGNKSSQRAGNNGTAGTTANSTYDDIVDAEFRVVNDD